MRTLITIVVLAILVVAAIIATSLIVNQQTRQGVEQRTSEAIGQPAQLDRARVGIFTGNFTLSTLSVSNPDGFDSPRFLGVATSDGKLRLGTLFADVVELPRLTLSDIELHLERRAGQSNFAPVLTSIRATEEQPNDNGRRYVIRELVLRDVVLNVNLAPEVGDVMQLRVPIQEMRLRDVGTEAEQGLMMQEVAAEIVKALLTAALEHAGDDLPAMIAEELSQRLGELDEIAARALEVMGERIDELEEVLEDFPLEDLLPPRR